MVLALAVTPARGDGPADLARRLETFHTPEAVTIGVRLEVRQERTIHGHTAKGEASVGIHAEQDATGLRVSWDSSLLKDAELESQERDRTADHLSPIRDAIKELDPARVSHLLSQAGSLVDLTKGGVLSEKTVAFEGRDARALVYRFEPRLSWTEAYYLRHREGRFTIWIAADGTPLASESLATFEGKTGRTFGRFSGATTMRTRYSAEGNRLRVAEREVDESSRREDGAETEHTWQRFVLTPQ